MQRPTTAQLILRGRHGQTRVRVSWPQATLATPRPAVSVLFSEQWLVQDRVTSEHIKPTAGELVLIPFWRASLGYEHGLDDALRVVEWTAAHAGDLGADPTCLRIRGAARLAFFIHDVIARMGAATAPGPRARDRRGDPGRRRDQSRLHDNETTKPSPDWARKEHPDVEHHLNCNLELIRKECHE